MEQAIGLPPTVRMKGERNDEAGIFRLHRGAKKIRTLRGEIATRLEGGEKNFKKPGKKNRQKKGLFACGGGRQKRTTGVRGEKEVNKKKALGGSSSGNGTRKKNEGSATDGKGKGRGERSGERKKTGEGRRGVRKGAGKERTWQRRKGAERLTGGSQNTRASGRS